MKTMTGTFFSAALIPSVGRAFSAPFVRLAASVVRERHDLSKLDAAMLRDIGISEAEAAAEARRPIWDLPSHRLGR